ncbi:MAG: ABC transporter permease subunit [Syntrophomonadaceae bacterium]|nr:ABC transporter permease subunit [Syntrophomonadaceae bacterium]
MIAIMQREWQENLRNYKTLFLLMFIFGGVLMALYTEVGPTANSQNVLDPFFELFAVLCPMIAIFAAMDAVVGEKEKGTLELVLSKPLPRRALLLGKYCAYVLMIVPLLVAELIAAYFCAQLSGISQYRWHLSMPPLSQWLTLVAILTCVSLFFVALTILISMFAPTTATTGLCALIFMAPAHPLGGEFLRQVGNLLHIDSFQGLPIIVKFFLSIFSKFQKFTLTNPSDALICCLSLLTMTVVVLLLSSWIFERQNVAFKN